MDALDRLASFDTCIIFVVLSVATHRTVDDFQTKQIKPLLVLGGPFLICAFTLLCTCFGIENDPRRNALVMLGIVFIPRCTFIAYILWRGLNGILRRFPRLPIKIVDRGITRVTSLFRAIKTPKQVAMKTVRLLTTEVATSRENAALSLLASTGTRFQHWTILVDGQCYELGRSHHSHSGKGVRYGPRIQPFEHWKIHRGLNIPGLTIKMETYYVGHTVLSSDEIREVAYKVWKTQFNSQYNLTFQNCQDFSDKVLRKIYYADGSPNLRQILRTPNGPRKLSTIYYRVTRPIRVPWMMTKWLAKISLGRYYYMWVGGRQQADGDEWDEWDESGEIKQATFETTAGEYPDRGETSFLDGAKEIIATDGEVVCIVQEEVTEEVSWNDSSSTLVNGRP